METWINQTWEKINHKLLNRCIVGRDTIPHTSDENGRYDDLSEKMPYWWTNGFWPGLMWLMYLDTKNEEYRKTAVRGEEILDEAFKNIKYLSHDVGFMWLISSGVNYRLHADDKSKDRLLYAAAILGSRYNLEGEFIRAWNDEGRQGWAIIDCMMNLPLLYHASAIENDPRFKYIAMNHADKTMNFHVRPDGSVNHIVCYDVATGEVLDTPGGQGYESGSSWSRGQAWGLYGFVLSYLHTKKQEYLDTAKRIAHYFISCICDDYVPKYDFRSPDEPVIYDTSAGAIAACGLLEIAKVVPEHEKKVYKNAAINILKALDEKFCDYTDKTDGILQGGTIAYHHGAKHRSLIYGDYYFVEALYKLRGNEMLLW